MHYIVFYIISCLILIIFYLNIYGSFIMSPTKPPRVTSYRFLVNQDTSLKVQWAVFKFQSNFLGFIFQNDLDSGFKFQIGGVLDYRALEVGPLALTAGVCAWVPRPPIFDLAYCVNGNFQLPEYLDGENLQWSPVGSVQTPHNSQVLTWVGRGEMLVS